MLDLGAQISARDRAMIHRFHVNGDDLACRRKARGRNRLRGIHHDENTLVGVVSPHGTIGVGDDYIRVPVRNCGAHTITENGVAGPIDSWLTESLQDDPDTVPICSSTRPNP